MSKKKKTEEEWVEPAIEDDDDFDFVDHYGAEIDTKSEDQLPDNTAKSALNCAFIGLVAVAEKWQRLF